jgi:hypothetical protein
MAHWAISPHWRYTSTRQRHTHALKGFDHFLSTFPEVKINPASNCHDDGGGPRNIDPCRTGVDQVGEKR